MRAVIVLFVGLAACASDPKPNTSTCPTDPGDAGDVATVTADRCNVPGSMGAHHWYRLFGDVSDTEVVQLELWDGRGAFAASGVVGPGTYQITDQELDPATCGVCLRAASDKGLATAREFIASAGTVVVDAVGSDANAPFVATVSGVAFEEVDADKQPVAGGCTSTVARAKMTGAIVIRGGSGGGTGGGGGGGAGGCPLTVGD